MKPIAVGDLVQIVKWPCCGHGLGAIFQYRENEPFGYHEWVCSKCKSPHPKEPLIASGWSKNDWSAPASWCKRIPPLDELEGVKTEEALKETA